MAQHRITQIPYPGSSGATPTGALQFRDDWPGLFVRGDDAIMLMGIIQELAKRLADHPDPIVRTRLMLLSRYADIISADVVVRHDH
jgi:hypothetical protein